MSAHQPDTTTPTLDKLAERIRATAKDGRPLATNLATNEKIIARITDGIYREPWAAFRELIANAYDADATSVVIETDAPYFKRILVRDDGAGMTPKTLAYVLKNIGGSSKRTPAGVQFGTAQAGAADRSPKGRMLIGKLGIGLFAVAQLTQHFQIITKSADDDVRTSASVRLQTYDDSELDSTTEYVAGKVEIISERVRPEEISSHGTAVILYDLRPKVLQTLRSERLWTSLNDETVGRSGIAPDYHIGFSDQEREAKLPWEDADDPDKKFIKFFNAIGAAAARRSKSATLEHLDHYLQLLWKVSLSLPLTYIGQHPFDLTGDTGLTFFNMQDDDRQAQEVKLDPKESIREHVRLKAGSENTKGDFRVSIDGVRLRRPVKPSLNLIKRSARTRIQTPVLLVGRQDNPFSQDQLKLAGGPLRFESYLYWNSQIVPKDTVGVLVRVREAAGVLFDPTFFNYQVSEQTRLRQITAEIYVHEGLESAINIDRESFNYSHPHYLYIQRWLHKALRLLVNRLKDIAKRDLNREHERALVELQDRSLAVWEKRYGQESDPPAPYEPWTGLPSEIGGLEIQWPDNGIIACDPTRVTALAIVLEAYGALSHLSVDERRELIVDVMHVLDSKT